MNKLKRLIEQRYRLPYTILAFLIAGSVILLIYPGQVGFKFEYQKNKAWQHKDLVAPFSFPLQKTKQERVAEEIWVKENRDLFFEKNADTESEVQRMLLLDWQNLLIGWPQLRQDSVALIRALRYVYKQGIIEDSWSQYNESKGRMLFVANQEAEVFMASDYLSRTAAAQTISKALGYEQNFSSNLLNFIDANIILNENLTTQALKVALEKRSETVAVINEGEIIIREGSLVDDVKVQALESLRAAYEVREDDLAIPYQLIIGQLIFICVLLATLFAFLVSFRSQILRSIADINLILFSVVWMTVLAITVIKINPEWLYIVPFPIVPIILRAFYDTRLALFVHIIIILLIGFYAPNSFEFIFLEFTAGVAAIIYVTGLYKRSQLFVAMSKIMAVYAIAYLGFVLLQENGIHKQEWLELSYLGASGVLSLFAFPLVFGYEKIFGQVSDLTLLELADTNSPILRDLAQKAPGTFQHSLQVANLAERAALTIGANTLLVRTGALYHDIGKTLQPEYFIENQVAGINPHDNLSFKESAEIIISHVNAGVILAKKAGLPNDVISFIRTHHGTTRVEYFYRQHIKSFQAEEVDVNVFTYPGPRPSSKEMAILMMADSTEAAARSLKEKTAEQINTLVETIIDAQLKAGQFNLADITLRDLEEVKEVFKQLLINIYHARIAYPEK
jgi:putative nucleotidyltransferase with HDIG domain